MKPWFETLEEEKGGGERENSLVVWRPTRFPNVRAKATMTRQEGNVDRGAREREVKNHHQLPFERRRFGVVDTIAVNLKCSVGVTHR